MFKKERNPQDPVELALQRQGTHLKLLLEEICEERDPIAIVHKISRNNGHRVNRAAVLALLNTKKVPTLPTLISIFRAVDHAITLRFKPVTVAVRRHPKPIWFHNDQQVIRRLAGYLLYVREQISQQRAAELPKSRSEDGGACPTVRTLNEIALGLECRLLITAEPLPANNVR